MINDRDLHSAILRSQACQRNYDFSKQIPQEHIDLLVHAATQAPTKQNYSYFDLYVVTDRERIKKITELTLGATVRNTQTEEPKLVYNEQVNAHVLFIFDLKSLKLMSQDYQDDQEIQEHDDPAQYKRANESTFRIFASDRDRSVGICSGQVALAASLLGYTSGYCQCFDYDDLREELNMRGDIGLMLGVGIPDESKPRLEHPDLPGWNFMKKRRDKTRVIEI